MPKLTVEKVTIERIGDGLIVHAGAKPHLFNQAAEAFQFARQSLGFPEEISARVTAFDKMWEDDGTSGCGIVHISPEDVVEDSLKDFGKSSIGNLGKRINERLAERDAAEAKRLVKNKAQRERAAKKKAAKKRKR